MVLSCMCRCSNDNRAGFVLVLVVLALVPQPYQHTAPTSQVQSVVRIHIIPIVFVLYPHHNNQRGIVIQGLLAVPCELWCRKRHTAQGVPAAAVLVLASTSIDVSSKSVRTEFYPNSPPPPPFSPSSQTPFSLPNGQRRRRS